MNFEFLHCQDIIFASLTLKIIIKCSIRLKTNFRTDQQWLSLLIQYGAGYLIEDKDGDGGGRQVKLAHSLGH